MPQQKDFALALFRKLTKTEQKYVIRGLKGLIVGRAMGRVVKQKIYTLFKREIRV